MGFLIAVSGKGGTGKTTVAALLIDQLIKSGCKPVLAVDADPNTCLDLSLGVKAIKTIGRVREETREDAVKGMASGISKQEMIELKIAESLVEADDFDLIAMGRPEGAGCYCYANNVLKTVIKKISDNYPYTVLDNEAGLENLSRRIVQEVDVLIMVADSSIAGIKTLIRLYELAAEMDIKFKKLILVINRLKSDKLPDTSVNMLKSINAFKIIGLPDNEEITEIAEKGKSMRSLSDKNEVREKITELIKEMKTNQV